MDAMSAKSSLGVLLHMQHLFLTTANSTNAQTRDLMNFRNSSWRYGCRVAKTKRQNHRQYSLTIPLHLNMLRHKKASDQIQLPKPQAHVAHVTIENDPFIVTMEHMTSRLVGIFCTCQTLHACTDHAVIIAPCYKWLRNTFQRVTWCDYQSMISRGMKSLAGAEDAYQPRCLVRHGHA